MLTNSAGYPNDARAPTVLSEHCVGGGGRVVFLLSQHLSIPSPKRVYVLHEMSNRLHGRPVRDVPRVVTPPEVCMNDPPGRLDTTQGDDSTHSGIASSPAFGRRGLTRRRFLQVGVTLSAASLAGCQSGDAPGTQSPTDSVDTGRPSASPTPTSRTLDTIRFDGGGAAALSEALRTAEANPGSTLAFEPGTYRLDGTEVGHSLPHSHFTTDGLEDVTIEGNDARLVLENPTMGAFGFYNCDGMTMRNLEIDYDPPPYAQGTITAVDAAANSLEVELEAGFPGLDSEYLSHPDLSASRRWATVHDPETGDFFDVPGIGATHVKFQGVERLGDRRFRVTGLQTMRGLAPGRLLVVVARWPFKHAILVFNCVEPTLADVTLRMSPGFSVLTADSASPTFRRFTVAPRPDSDRVIASNADGIHCLACAPGPTIEDCHMERLQDDSYVVASLMNPVEELVDDRTVRVEPLLGTRIRPDDAIEGIGADFARLGALPDVESVETSPPGRLPGDWGRPAVVTFAEPVAGTVEPGDFLRNRSRSNQGFTIRNNVSREVRPRHVRVTSRDGVIEGNELDGCGMPAVMLAGGKFFAPQSPPENVTVRNNTIVRAGTYGFTTPHLGAVDAWINLEGWRSGPHPADRAIRNLTVTGNTIRNCAFRAIQVNDTDGVAIRNNEIESPNQVGHDAPDYGIGLINDRAVDLVDNRVSGTASDLDQFAVRTATEDLEARDNVLTVDGNSVTPEVVDGS